MHWYLSPHFGGTRFSDPNGLMPLFWPKLLAFSEKSVPLFTIQYNSIFLIKVILSFS